ncbi:MAG: NUDIX hydrolase [Balneolaceae bacterium]
MRKDTKVYETPIFNLHQKEVVPERSEEPAPFYVIKAPEWINVIARTATGEILLVEQYRHGTEQVTLEIPGGMVDAGELPMEAARRELLEETGFQSSHWTSLGVSSSNPAILSNRTHMFFADGCEETGPQQTDGHEDIQVHHVPEASFFEMIGNGTIDHAIVLAAACRWLLQKSSR